MAFAHRNEDVKGQREEFQPQEKDDPVQGSGHQDHARRGQEQKAIEFVPGKAPGPGILAQEQDGQEGDGREEKGKETVIAAQAQHKFGTGIVGSHHQGHHPGGHGRQ